MFHILIVDDDKNTRRLLQAVLEAESYSVFTAENGEDAFAVIDHAHIDLIVLAFGQPEVTRAAVEDALSIEDVVPFTRDLFSWLQAQTFAKLVKLPNGEAGKGD